MIEEAGTEVEVGVGTKEVVTEKVGVCNVKCNAMCPALSFRQI